jgi:hypothetical protein
MTKRKMTMRVTIELNAEILWQSDYRVNAVPWSNGDVQMKAFYRTLASLVISARR